MSLSQNTVVRSLASGDESTDWRQRGSCSGMATEVFFGDVDSDSGEELRPWEIRAKQICRVCPVLETCRAKMMRERWGVFGGLAAQERTAIRRHQRVRRETARRAALRAEARAKQPPRATAFQPLPYLTEKETARFWASIRVTEAGCWIWTGYVRSRWPRFHAAGRKLTPRRVAHWLLTEQQPTEALKGHCGNHLCCRPAVATDARVEVAA